MEVQELIEVIARISGTDACLFSENTPLVGGKSSVDSMDLVQICLALEERSIEESFRFNWTSEKAMSSLNSIFSSPQALTSEYNKQKQNQQQQ